MSRSGNLLIDQDPVRTALNALVESSDQFRLLNEERVVIRADWQQDKVAIVSGGGSGHEPFAAGLVGHGGITGAVCGSVFVQGSPQVTLGSIE